MVKNRIIELYGAEKRETCMLPFIEFRQREYEKRHWPHSESVER